MRGLGSGDNGEFTFLDLVSLMSFSIAIQNNNLLNQQDKQELENELSSALDEIHGHLQSQDRKLNRILQLLEENYNDGINKETGRPDK